MFDNLNKVLCSSNRISSVDIWRGIAIISVVLYHFNETLPYGSLGVDLFFVISGLLVGGLLTKPFLNGDKLEFFKFFLRRGFKIWPSYYTFLVFGTIIAVLKYNPQNQNQIISLTDFKRYFLFYQNYTGTPVHWSFDHVWSLCVEEHFYILLPLTFMILRLIKANWKALLGTLIGLVALGLVSKFLMLYYTSGKDTYAATHNRIDALAYGVILNLIIIKFPKTIKKHKIIFLITGLIGLIATIFFDIYLESIFYQKIVLHSIVPLFFFLLISGTYYHDFSRLKLLRIIGYYSYNWYLWHPVFAVIITQKIGVGLYGLIVYLVASFIIGVFFTIAVEEPALKIRNNLLNKKFK